MGLYMDVKYAEGGQPGTLPQVYRQLTVTTLTVSLRALVCVCVWGGGGCLRPVPPADCEESQFAWWKDQSFLIIFPSLVS